MRKYYEGNPAIEDSETVVETLDVADMIPNKYEPKRTFRWVLEIEHIDSFLMKEASRPSFQIDGNGKKVLRPLHVVLYDPIAPSGAQQVMEWIDDASRRHAVLKVLDPVGTVVERWDLEGLKPVDVDFGVLSYADENPCTITLQLEYVDFKYCF